MENDLTCPNCGEPVESGTAFCGNCGQPLRSSTSVSPIAAVYAKGNAGPGPGLNPTMIGAVATAGVPLAPVAIQPHHHVKAALALVFGVLGLAGAFFIPLVGIALGVTGLVLASLAPQHVGRGLKVVGLIVSSLALLTGLATWVYVIAHDPELHPAAATQAGTTNGVASLEVTTPCYSVGFPRELNVDNAKGSCEMNAYDGDTLADSSDVYKVLTTNTTDVTAANLNAVAQKAIESDISQNLPGFAITSEQGGRFAGFPAYFVQADQPSTNVAVEEAAVLRTSASTNNFFVLVHATTGTKTDLSGLERQWQWN